MSKTMPADVDTTGLSIDGERPLAEALRVALAHSAHDAARCADPGGWHPERCTCWRRDAKAVLAEHDATIALIAKKRAEMRARARERR